MRGAAMGRNVKYLQQRRQQQLNLFRRQAGCHSVHNTIKETGKHEEKGSEGRDKM